MLHNCEQQCRMTIPQTVNKQLGNSVAEKKIVRENYVPELCLRSNCGLQKKVGVEKKTRKL